MRPTRTDFYYDPSPHETLKLQIEMLRSGSRGAFLDIYVRYDTWPTTVEYDARMRVDHIQTPSATFILPSDRLLNERLCVMVVCTGDTWASYALQTQATPSGAALFMRALVGVPIVLGAGVAAWRWRRARREASKLLGESGGD